MKACALALAIVWLRLRAPNLLVSPRFWAEEANFVSAATRLDGSESILFY